MAAEQLIQTLKEAAAAHHGYEETTLKGQRDEQALGWYAGFVLGRLGNFASPSDLEAWFQETHVMNKYEEAARNVMQHLADAGVRDFSFSKPQTLSRDRATAETQLTETLIAAADAHHEYETVTLHGELDKQALGWYAGYTIGRLGDFTTPSNLATWLTETHVKDKYAIAAKNVFNHYEASTQQLAGNQRHATHKAKKPASKSVPGM